ncbi:hypothetical protein [Facilibium subflavum]|uniref:hypothetical protein n=1 Tax=Facilibium subflavum TaxID=2219058 RepID=UPI000E65DB7C|nr:hypothetical protein [Facilibium subflavum]
MVQLDIANNALQIKMPLMDKVMAMRSNLEIKLSDIQNAKALTTFEMPTGAKIKGTRIGKKAYGTFENNNETEFWAVDNSPSILLIELSPHAQSQYQRFFLGVDNPNDWVSKLTAK